MKVLSIVLVGFVLMAGGCRNDTSTPEPNSKAQPELSPICKELNRTINRQLAYAAVTAKRRGNADGYLTQVRTNIELLGQNRCPARTKPIDISSFGAEDVLQCDMALIGSGTGDKADIEKVDKKCDSGTWSKF